MTGTHTDLGPELRQLAQAILDKVDPVVRLAAARAAAAAAAGPGQCQQVWCPVCALAAVINGEQHPLLQLISEHSVALLAVIRAVLNDSADSDAPGPPDGGPDGPPPEDSPPGHYQHIPVTVED
jgi:hypothetical protein